MPDPFLRNQTRNNLSGPRPGLLAVLHMKYRTLRHNRITKSFRICKAGWTWTNPSDLPHRARRRTVRPRRASSRAPCNGSGAGTSWTSRDSVLNCPIGSVADPGCYPGSWFLPIPDPGSRIPDPKTAKKKRDKKKFVVIPFFVATNFIKLQIISFINVEEKFLATFKKL